MKSFSLKKLREYVKTFKDTPAGEMYREALDEIVRLRKKLREVNNMGKDIIKMCQANHEALLRRHSVYRNSK